MPVWARAAWARGRRAAGRLVSADDQAQGPVDQADDDAACERPTKAVYDEGHRKVACDPGGEHEHERVDDDEEQAKGQNVERQGEYLDDRANDHVHCPEYRTRQQEVDGCLAAGAEVRKQGVAGAG